MDTNLPIGLNAEDSAALSKELNALLCDLHVFYQNVRGFHWNVQGQNFFEPCRTTWLAPPFLP